MFQTRALVGGCDVCGVLKCPAAVHNCPPVHRFCCAPWIHISGYADQYLRSVSRQLTNGLGKYPVVTNRATNASNRRGCHGKQRFIVAFMLMGTRLDFGWNPRVYLAILVQNAFRPDQARRVKDDAWPLWINLQH